MKISEIPWERWMKPEKGNGFFQESPKENIPTTGITPAIFYLPYFSDYPS